jgi:hypothetical protein
MRREWELEDLIACWTLDEEEFALLANKSGATRLGFAVLLKYFEQEARFPRREDVPRAAVDFVAGQVKVGPELFAGYDFTSRQAANHRGQVRDFYKFAKATVQDEDGLAVWLSTDMCPVETSRDRLRAALLARCRELRIEPPAPGQIERVLGEAESLFGKDFTACTQSRLPDGSAGKLEELLLEGEDGDPAGGRRGFLQELKDDPGSFQLDTLLAEIAKLGRVNAIGLPADLFDGCRRRSWRRGGLPLSAMCPCVPASGGSRGAPLLVDGCGYPDPVSAGRAMPVRHPLLPSSSGRTLTQASPRHPVPGRTAPSLPCRGRAATPLWRSCRWRGVPACA